MKKTVPAIHGKHFKDFLGMNRITNQQSNRCCQQKSFSTGVPDFHSAVFFIQMQVM
jgi:hypothetical protein